MNTQCIKEEVLFDYLEGRLSDKKRQKIERHLADCDNCLEVLGVAAEMIRDSSLSDLGSVPEHVTRQALKAAKASKEASLSVRISGYVRQFASRCADVLAESVTLRSPSYATVRGSKTAVGDDLILFKKVIDDMDTTLEIEKKGNDRANIKVIVIKGDRPEESLRITLIHKGREVGSYLSFSAFFEDVSFGQYVIRLTRFTEQGAKLTEIPFELATRNAQPVTRNP